MPNIVKPIIIQKIEEFEKKILLDIKNQLQNNLNEKDISIWLFYYHKFVDALRHWKLLQNDDGNEKWVEDSFIPRGYGTIGYILDKNDSEFVDDTFDDPRGSVAIEDEIIGNLAWGGVPICDLDNNELLSIISFFPTKQNNWEDLNKSKNDIKKYIDEKSDILRLLTFLKFLREELDILYNDVDLNDESYEGNINILLRKIRALAYKTSHFRNIIYLEKVLDKNEYRINNSKFIVHDYIKTRLKLIDRFKWIGIQKSYDKNNILGGYFSKIDAQNSYLKIYISKNYYFKIILNKNCENNFQNNIIEFFNSYKNLFDVIENYNPNPEGWTLFKTQKVKNEIIIALFQTLTQCIIYPEKFDDLSEKFNKICDFIKAKFELKGSYVLKNFIYPDQKEKDNIVAFSVLKTNNSGWRISDYPKNLEEQIKKPGNLNVLLRLVDILSSSNKNNNKKSIQDELLSKYRLRESWVFLEPDVLNKKVVLKINNEKFTDPPYKIEFEKEEYDVLLDIVVNSIGFEKFLYSNICSDVNISCIDQKNISIKKVKNILDFFDLNGKYEVLCSDKNGNSIIIGPIKEGEEIPRQLKEFAEKNFKRLILIETQKELKKALLKTAIISILIDSYAHNISAHSLAALKWWIELRHKMLDKRFKIPQNELVLNCINPCLYSIDKNKTIKTTEKYYEALGLTDSTYNADYYSLYDFLQFAENDVVKDLFKYTSEVIPKEGQKFKFHPRFPVPIDYALYPFFRFLRDKGAFWSGVTRDMAFGGESKTWYKILWEDFANNPLYLGTIAKSEGITKINIYLKVKTKEECIQGKFVTIDMSIIDYEEKLSQSPTLEPNEFLLKNTVKEDDCNFSDNCSVKYDKYSKYAFVKLGKCFKGFREILDNEENFRVFLPGGIVGEHALFTIFENTIRNIKHYKDPNTLKYIQENGIDFWISIEEDKLSISKDNSDKKPELFKVGVWLGHETKLITKEETKNDDDTLKEPAEYLLFNITNNTLKPILDEFTGTPRMGGNSQDKACAAMLFNNKFSSVEDKERERDKEYFPWIRFATTIGRNEYLLDIKSDTTEMEIEELKNQYSNKFLCCGNNGYLKKYFYVWRGEDVLDKNALSAEDWENPARAKFLVNDKEWNDEDIIINARKNGIIRLLDGCNDLSVNKLYKEWLRKWLGLNSQNVSMYIGLQSGKDQANLSSTGAIRVKDKTIVFYCGSGAEDYNGTKTILKLAHGEEQDFHCNVRSHGVFFQKFFTDCDLNTIGEKKINVDDNHNLINDNKEKIEKNETLLLELIEAVLTKVVIFDNRVNERFKSYTDNKIKMLNDDLFLIIYNEDKQKWDNFKINIKKINFLVIHLSFIESLGYKENIEEFIKNELGFANILNENFILVITSGRGRKDWEESIKTIEYKKITIFKPIESILNSIESGISYNDHFDIKYYLIKTLIGS